LFRFKANFINILIFNRVNCPFYFKIGACRHGERCSRIHNKPTMSETILLKNMYNNPSATIANVDGSLLEVDEKENSRHFEEFYEDVFQELSNFGEIEEMNVCANIGDHLLGNVYVKFCKEEDAEKSIKGLNGRFYGGRPIQAEFSPVTDFREARCRQYDLNECTRGGYCNFIHFKEISRDLKRKLFPRKNKPREERYDKSYYNYDRDHNETRRDYRDEERDYRESYDSRRHHDKDYDRHERGDRHERHERDDRHSTSSSSRSHSRRSRSRTPEKRRPDVPPAQP